MKSDDYLSFTPVAFPQRPLPAATTSEGGRVRNALSTGSTLTTLTTAKRATRPLPKRRAHQAHRARGESARAPGWAEVVGVRADYTQKPFGGWRVTVCPDSTRPDTVAPTVQPSVRWFADLHAAYQDARERIEVLAAEMGAPVLVRHLVDGDPGAWAELAAREVGSGVASQTHTWFMPPPDSECV